MGFSFLAPLFLLGLAAIAIPVFIHLTHRERKEAVPFPSLMFVRKIPYRTVRRQRIRHWLLFLMRVAAVVLVVAAFARPWLDNSTEAVASFARARELVVLLDRSHSMAYGDRWERAIEAARGALGNLGPDDRATLATFSDRAEAITQPSGDPAVLLAALGGVTTGAGVTHYGPALQLAREIVARSELPNAEVLLISDLQASGWDPRNAVRLPAGTRLSIVDLSDVQASNLAVTGASTSRVREGARDEIVITAAVANFGPRPIDDVSVHLDVEGERVQTRQIDVAVDGTATVTFEPVVVPGRPVVATVQAGEDLLPGDNRFHLVMAPEARVSVLIVEPGNASANHSLFLQSALAVGQRPGFDVDVRRDTRLTTADLEGRSVVIFNDAPTPAGVLGRELADFVDEGGGLLVVLGRRSPPAGWPADAPDLLPAAVGGMEDRSAAGGGTLGYLDYDHPALELFRAPRSGDFSAARFYRYRRVEVGPLSRTLARFDDGSPALVEVRHGDGAVLLWASGLENFWNDLAIQPVFVPFLHQLVKHLAGYRQAESWFRVGRVLDLSEIPALASDVVVGDLELIVERPSGSDRVMRPARDGWYLGLEEQGIYRVRRANVDAGGVIVAANLDPAESDLTSVDLQEMAGASITQGAAGGPAAGAAILSVEQRERRQGLWWYLLAVAGILLLLETLLSNRAAGAATYVTGAN
ncbi:MAG TPA: BatA domain-containing protein [Gemmatimonadota bacterium]|nr:BatA domain-containing protein [Gemmatimonadota bacterium]